MKKPVLVVLAALCLACAPALALEKKKAAEKKPETGASCKAPAVGGCAACSVTCPPGETATCKSGVLAGNACHIQPVCRCGH